MTNIIGISSQYAHKEVDSIMESERFCIDCNEEIPVVRREMVEGCKRCINCQIKKELLNG